VGWFVLVYLIVFVGTAAYAGIDMGRRGRNGWPYVGGIIVFGFLGVLAWVIGRAKYPVMRGHS
jgi:hypothetical protein